MAKRTPLPALPGTAAAHAEPEPTARRTRTRSAPARKRAHMAIAAATAIAAAAVTAATISLGAAQPAAADTSDGLPCGDCVSLFDNLRADIGTYIPAVQQQSFLTRVNEASDALSLNILPPSPILPPDPIYPAACAASMILDNLTADAGGLASAGLVSAAGLSAITTDVTSLQDEVFIPTEPCLPPSPIRD